MGIILLCSCGGDDEETPQETLYPVTASDIEFTMTNPIMWVATTDKGSMSYTFIDFSRSGEKSIKEGIMKESQDYRFNYTFSNSGVTATYEDGKVERIEMKKNVPGVPSSSDKVYFNGLVFRKFIIK